MKDVQKPWEASEAEIAAWLAQSLRNMVIPEDAGSGKAYSPLGGVPMEGKNTPALGLTEVIVNVENAGGRHTSPDVGISGGGSIRGRKLA